MEFSRVAESRMKTNKKAGKHEREAQRDDGRSIGAVRGKDGQGVWLVDCCARQYRSVTEAGFRL